MDTPTKEERDLSFAPTINESPLRLSREQIAFYNAEGYVAPFRAYNHADADANRTYFDDLLLKVQTQRPDLDAYSVNGFQVCCQGLYDIVMNPFILDCVQDIIGPDIIAWGTHFFCKQPHDPRKVAWHQDTSYWPFTPARTVTVWLAIDHADQENAAMKFIPRSHNKGHLKWRDVTGQAVLNQEIEDTESLGQPVYDELKAGEFSLHADMLAHGSDPNSSDRRRCGLTIRYCPVSVRKLNPAWGQGAILCRGSYPDNAWTHNPRPPGEDVTVMVKRIGAN